MYDVISKQELEIFSRDGFVTIRTPFTDDRLAEARRSAAALYDKGVGVIGSWISGEIRDEILVALMTDPFFERLAQITLRADDVVLASYGHRRTYGRPEAEPKLRTSTSI